MKGEKVFLVFVVMISIFSFRSKAQNGKEIDEAIRDVQLENFAAVESYFAEGYNLYPEVPKGVAEAVAYVNTRFWPVPVLIDSSCTGMPRYIGVMGYVFDGKSYFKESGKIVSRLSGISEDTLKVSARKQVLAWFAAYDSLRKILDIRSQGLEDVAKVLIQLSEIPYSKNDHVNDYAMSQHLYAVIQFLSDPFWASRCGFDVLDNDGTDIFEEDAIEILASSKVRIGTNGVLRADSNTEAPHPFLKSTLSSDYAPAIWDPTTCNYSSRSGVPVSAYVLHTVQGSYAGCISWFKNCSASASTHYVMRSSDGQVTQMVLESNKAWHVRDENPYTIGTEMEGYVDNAAWYTEAVYTSHSNLVRDICNSGYGINPLRTLFRDTLDNGSSLDNGIHVLAGSSYCTKIAGHQHYPNNDHTDPGRHWCWDYFFRKLNNNPTTVTYTTASGTLYDSGGSASAYGNDEHKVWVIAPVGASSVTLTFSAFDVEDNYDFLYIYDGPDIFSPRIGRYNTTAPVSVTASSGIMTVEFRSDCATTAAGWTATWSSQTADVTAPSTLVSSSGTWKTDDFTASFADSDNSGGSGIQKGYYQVLENQGSEWRANSSRGFFADNFDAAIHTDWTMTSGNWSIDSQNLYQSDTTISNTNIYTTVTQTLSNRTLYHFRAMVPGSSKINKRFGLHYFSDNGSLTNRGNGYFIFFRIESDQLEFYKVVNDVFTQEHVVTGVVTNLNQWYDYKLIYDRITGLTQVYRDDALIGTWTDASPYSTGGSYVSFRTGNARVRFDELKIYRSRAATADILVGNQPGDDIRYQNPSPTVYGAKIKSVCQDVANNLSAIDYHDLNVDFTAPDSIVAVNDGSGVDEDVSYSSSTLHANWSASNDVQSGISHYLVAIGTSSGASDVMSWSSQGLTLSASFNGLTLVQGSTYFISVKPVNAAGLEGAISVSDGITVATSTLAGFIMSDNSICEEDSIHFYNSSIGAISYLWEFEGGNPASSTMMNPVVYYATSGLYDVTLHAYGVGDTADLYSAMAVQVTAGPVADFVVNDTLLFIPDAMALFSNSSTGAINYIWDFGDGSGSSDVNPWHLYGDTGVFSVQLVANSTACGNDTLFKQSMITVLFPEGISEVDQNEISLFPNPAKDYVNIVRLDAPLNEALVIIYNMDGQTCYSTAFAQGQTVLKLSLSEFANGLYRVVIRGEDEMSIPLVIE